MTRICAALALVLLIGACTDLSAVRDFARSSSAVSTNDPVIASWPTSYDAARRLAAVPGMPRDLGPALNAAAEGAKKDVPLALQAAKALGLYFDVLIKLADDKLPDVSSQAATINADVAKLAPGNATAMNATAGLLDVVGVALDAWRKIAIRDLVIHSNADIQEITRFLATTSLEVQKADKFAKGVTDQYWETEGARSHDAGVRGLVLKQERIDDADYDTRIAQATAGAAAFTKIGADHAVLAKNADRLSAAEVQDTLSNDLPTLLNALKVFGLK